MTVSLGKGAVALTSDDTTDRAVLDVGGSPVADRVGVAVLGDIAQAGVLAAVQDDADHLSHLGTGHDARRIISAVILAGDNAQLNQGGDGLFVDDLVLVGEVVVVRSGSANDHHADQHNGSQSQAENPLEVSHLEFLLQNFESGDA